MPTGQTYPSVFSYVDYRGFLKDYYRARKARDSKFSHRFISAHVRAASAGWFSDLVAGRINLSGTHMIKLIQLLALKETEAEYFGCLVRYAQAASLEEKSGHYKKLIAIKGVKPEIVGTDRFEFYSAWYHAVIRELLLFSDFNDDPAALAKRLRPAIGATEVKKSIRLLESLGFLVKGPGGSYRAAPGTLKKDPAFKSVHLDSYFKANIRLGQDSLETVAKEERDISTMTFSLSAPGFERAKEELRNMRNRLLALTESEGPPERVYQCNIHLFPVTR